MDISASSIRPDLSSAEATSRMLLCRFIAISAKGQIIRALASNELQVGLQVTSVSILDIDNEIKQMAEFALILPQIHLFRTRIIVIREEGHQIDRLEDIYNSLYTIEVEALAGTGNWTQISNLVSCICPRVDSDYKVGTVYGAIAHRILRRMIRRSM